jgi:hypothetical protein
MKKEHNLQEPLKQVLNIPVVISSANIICNNCRWSIWQHYESGKRNWCSKESHKITKGKSNCHNFQWD